MGELTRRGFLLSCLALGAAPAIVRADSLMRVVAKDVGVLRADVHIFAGGITWVDDEYADGVCGEWNRRLDNAIVLELCR